SEEIQVCLAHNGQPDGFAGLIILGRTELARHLSARCMDWLAACLSLHIHLMPLDLDEALELLSCRGGTAPLEAAGFVWASPRRPWKSRTPASPGRVAIIGCWIAGQRCRGRSRRMPVHLERSAPFGLAGVDWARGCM